MLEIEVKYPCPSHAALRFALAAWGARFGPARLEEDLYFNAPDRDFARTDEALRLRRTGRRNSLTYKGPKLDAETKTRLEVVVRLADGSRDAARLLAGLGYRPVAKVIKRRRVCRFKRGAFRVEASLDEVRGLGLFVELEILAPPSKRRAATALLLDTARALGLSGSERRSYLELLRERTRRRARPDGRRAAVRRSSQAS